jgi:hypothetical protein
VTELTTSTLGVGALAAAGGGLDSHFGDGVCGVC